LRKLYMHINPDLVSLTLNGLILLCGIIMLLRPSFLVIKPADFKKPFNPKVFRWMGLVFFVIALLNILRGW
jgi:hypothetical protein